MKRTKLPRCKAHPKYRGKQRPRCKCAACWEIFSVAILRSPEFKAMLKKIYIEAYRSTPLVMVRWP